MAKPNIPGNPAPTSPYVYRAIDSAGLTISGSFNFNTSTGALVNVSGVCATLHRDAGCHYTQVIIGLINPDGSLGTGAKTFDLTGFSGDKTFTAAQLSAVGLNTLADVRAVQITAR